MPCYVCDLIKRFYNKSLILASLLLCICERSEASLWAVSNAKQKKLARSKSDIAQTRTAFVRERVVAPELATVANEVKLSL